jgi:hypothetical protein
MIRIPRKWLPVATLILLVGALAMLGGHDYLRYEQQNETARWQAGFEEGIQAGILEARQQMVKKLACYPIASTDGAIESDLLCGVRMSRKDFDAVSADGADREQ